MITKFWVIAGPGARNWIELLRQVEASFELCTLEKLQDIEGADQALCTDTADKARQLLLMLPENPPVVLAYTKNHPPGEVIIDMGSYFSSKNIMDIMS